MSECSVLLRSYWMLLKKSRASQGWKEALLKSYITIFEQCEAWKCALLQSTEYVNKNAFNTKGGKSGLWREKKKSSTKKKRFSATSVVVVATNHAQFNVWHEHGTKLFLRTIRKTKENCTFEFVRINVELCIIIYWEEWMSSNVVVLNYLTNKVKHENRLHGYFCD